MANGAYKKTGGVLCDSACACVESSEVKAVRACVVVKIRNETSTNLFFLTIILSLSVCTLHVICRRQAIDHE